MLVDVHCHLYLLEDIEAALNRATKVGLKTIISNSDNLPLNFYLGQNYPNPFNSLTHIKFSIKELSHVKLKIYDITGRKISTLRDEYLPAGRHELEWNGANAGSGMYLVYCEAEGNKARGKIVVVR